MRIQETEDRGQKTEARNRKIIPFPRRKRHDKPKPAFLVGGAYLDRLEMERYIEERITRVEEMAMEIREMV
jgi:hypothetical protein